MVSDEVFNNGISDIVVALERLTDNLPSGIDERLIFAVGNVASMLEDIYKVLQQLITAIDEHS